MILCTRVNLHRHNMDATVASDSDGPMADLPSLPQSATRLSIRPLIGLKCFGSLDITE